MTWWPPFRRRDQELDEEIRSHLDLAAQDRLDRGESPESARVNARREFGNQALVREITREMWSWSALERLGQDVRYGLRMMRRSPGFTAVIVLCLAFGTGANTAMFSLLDAVVLRKLPVRDPQQLVELLSVYPGEPRHVAGVSRETYERFRDQSHGLSDLFGSARSVPFEVSRDGRAATTILGAFVTGNLFPALGVQPALGRLIQPEDDEQRRADGVVVVVGWEYWKRQFNLDPSILDARILVNGVPARIVGVAPSSFSGLVPGTRENLWLPASMASVAQGAGQSAPDSLRLGLMGRLKPGVSIERASAEIRVLDEQSREPIGRHGLTLALAPSATGFSMLRDYLSEPLIVLMAVVAVLLLVACTNVASMLLAKAAARQREMAVRISLGAGRARLIQQVLTESLLISIIAAVLGAGIGFVGAHALARLLVAGRGGGYFYLASIPLRLDLHVLAFTVAIALATGVLFGAAPAWNAFASAKTALLRQRGDASETRWRSVFGRTLVAVQIALSLILLSGAAIFVRHLSNLRADLGFSRDSVLLVTLDPRGSGYDRQRLTHAYEELLQRIEMIPGVVSATLCGVTPSSGAGAARFIAVDGFHEDAGARRFVALNWVAPRYFETLRTPLLAGRDFRFEDRTLPRVAIVNEALAQYYFHGRDPIGGRITIDGEDRPYEVIGVVANAKYGELREPAPRTMYMNAFQEGRVFSEFAIRSTRSPASLAGPVRRLVEDTVKPVRVSTISTIAEQVDAALVPERLTAMLSTMIGGSGALLAALGLYGLVAFMVTRRTNEIGIRLALGATRRDVATMVVKDALGLVAAGLLLGAPVVIWSRHVAAAFIHNLRVDGIVPIASAALAMAALSLVAAYLPARRASRVDPMEALRHE